MPDDPATPPDVDISPPPADRPMPSPGRDPYGSDVGCMIILGLMILLLPTMMFGTALLVAAIVMAAAVAWLLERFSPALLHGRLSRWQLWLVYFLILLVIAIAAVFWLQHLLNGGDDDYIRG